MSEDVKGALPKPSFRFLVSNFATQALMELGEIENPITRKSEFAPNRAKFTIDLLEVVKTKTEGNLDSSEAKLIEDALFDLRMRYVRKLKSD